MQPVWMVDPNWMVSGPTPEVWKSKILFILDFHTRHLINMVSASHNPSSTIAGDEIDHTELWQSEESSEEGGYFVNASPCASIRLTIHQRLLEQSREHSRHDRMAPKSSSRIGTNSPVMIAEIGSIFRSTGLC
jgi:hypothetical protein